MHCVFVVLEKSILQNTEEITVLVLERQGKPYNVHLTGEGHVPSARNGSEVCCREKANHSLWKLAFSKDPLSAISCLPS